VKLVVIGLSLSSSWGNGHATTYRALLRAFAARGHEVLFLECDLPWYAAHRDLPRPDFCRLELYRDLEHLRSGWGQAVAAADAVIVGSFVADGVEVGRWAQRTARGAVAFYDIDTPVTLGRLARGDAEYISPDIIPGYDLYLSFTGGPTLELLEQRYGARHARALYCSVDADVYQPVATPIRWDLSYLGTTAPTGSRRSTGCSSRPRGGRPISASASPARNIRKPSPGPPMSSGWSMSRRTSIRPSTARAASR
jgi:spore maturation protein CgeB